MTHYPTLSRWARAVFALHLILAVAIGAALLAAPAAFCGWFGYTVTPETEPLLCAFGALLIGAGGLTSLFGLFARTWEQVDYIVRAEILYLALQTAIFVVSALTGRGPVPANWLFAALSGVLLVLFAFLYVARPGQSDRRSHHPFFPLRPHTNERG